MSGKYMESVDNENKEGIANEVPSINQWDFRESKR